MNTNSGDEFTAISCRNANEAMTDPLSTHVSIVKRELNAGVTDRDDLIRAVLAHHAACGHYWWTAMDAAKWVDIALAKIKLEEQNGKS